MVPHVARAVLLFVKRVSRASLLPAIAVLGLPLSAQAAALSLSGNVSWQQNGNQVTLRADQVANTSSTGTSGSIRLQLWATASRFSGGTINGYVLATYQFSQVLAPNQYYSNVSATVPFTTPPNGTYYTTLTLEEYTGSSWVIRDYLTFSSTTTWGGGLSLSGNTMWQQNGSVVTLSVERVSNNGSGTSGSIRLQLWATSTRYSGGAINGYILANYQFTQVLGPNQSYSNVNQTVSFTTPPGGTYYTTLTLEEFTSSGWVIRDYVTYNSTTTWAGGGGSALSMSGNTSWQQNGNVVTIAVDRISNNSTVTSGSIRLQLWATAARYSGATINGYVLGTYQFADVLGPNQYYSDINQTVSFTAPPNGTYYSSLTLEEFTNSGWVIRDFVTYDSTNTWGSTTNTVPFGFIDYPPTGAVVNGTVSVYGWALDAEDSNLSISLSVDGQPVLSNPSRSARPDVCNAIRNLPHCSTSNPGWAFNWNTQTISNGLHTISILLRDPQGAQTSLSTVVTIANQSAADTAPFGFMDYPPGDLAVSGTIAVFGWALDAEDSNLTISISVDGQLVSSSPSRSGRPDVCNAYRNIAHCSSSNPGWTFSWNTQTISNGSHTISILLRDPQGAQTSLSTVVNVFNQSVNTPPFGTFDYPATGATVNGTVAAYGWALDAEDPNLTISLSVDGQLVSSSPSRLGRPDVCNAYRNVAHCSSSNPGWAFSWNTQTISNGSHTISILLRDPQGAQTSLSTVVNVFNQSVNTPPFGAFDYPATGATVTGTVAAYGWALDAEDSNLTISLSVDGQLVSSNPSRLGRPDVCNAYRNVAHCSSSNPGWTFNWNPQSVANGSHTLTVLVRDPGGAQASFSTVINLQMQPAAIISTVNVGTNITPGGIAVVAGALIVADTDRHRVLKVAPDGVTTIIAGTGTPGFNGDGPAITRQLNAPTGVAVDGAGYIYIADSLNQRIRVVSPSGAMTTVAGNGTSGFGGDGGNALQAAFSFPSSVAVDAAFRIYIADTNNNRIRMVANGVITTVAGNGTFFGGSDGSRAAAGGIAQPRGVAVDGRGNFLFADSGNQCVRRVDAGGIITTVAGLVVQGFCIGESGSSGDSGPATSARLAEPWGLNVDLAGNLYIAESVGNRVRKVTAEGVISTVAGTGTPGSSGDGGPATSAQLHAPRAVASDYFASTLFISDTFNGRIRKVSFAP